MFFITNSRQNKQKERKTGFSSSFGYIGHHRLHEAEEEEAALERLSLFLSLSLCWEKIHSPRRQLLTHFVQCTSQRSAAKQCVLRCIIIVSIITFHQKGEKERDPRSLSRARTAREQLKRAWERYKTKKPLSSSYSYLKLTHSIIRWNQSRRTAHKKFIALIIIVSRRVLLPSTPFTRKRSNTTVRARPQNTLSPSYSSIFNNNTKTHLCLRWKKKWRGKKKREAKKEQKFSSNFLFLFLLPWTHKLSHLHISILYIHIVSH